MIRRFIAIQCCAVRAILADLGVRGTGFIVPLYIAAPPPVLSHTLSLIQAKMASGRLFETRVFADAASFP